MDKLILIGVIQDLFDKEIPKKYIKDAKFIIISTDGVSLKMIMHLPEPPYEYHPEAVKKFMDDNGYNEVRCYGGAKIVLGTIPEILFHGKSYSFGIPSDENIKRIANEIWPGYDLEIMTSRPKLAEGRIYNRESIQHLIDNA